MKKALLPCSHKGERSEPDGKNQIVKKYINSKFVNLLGFYLL